MGGNGSCESTEIVGTALAADLTRGTPPTTGTPPAWQEPLSQDQKILHLLNRITFGPRPGDTERVREIGIEKFLEEQLHPEKLDDAALEARLASLPTLSMSTAELLENFPPPKLARQQALAGAEGRSQAGGGERPSGLQRRATPNEMQSMERGMMAPEGPRRVIMELAREELWRAVYSNRQLQEVMVQLWMNHFNIFAPKGADRWLLTSFERDAIRPHAMGRFEDLLAATAESPAMLFYLDNWMSATPNPTFAGDFRQNRGQPAPQWGRGMSNSGMILRGLALGRRGIFGRGPFGRGPWDNRRPRNPQTQQPRPDQAKGPRPQVRRGLNENYARELMELHTLGVDGGYTQHDVIEVARCFTGWTIDRPRQGGGFTFNPRMHDFGEKMVLGRKIHKGRGMEDGLEVLHRLAQHPSTAHFISLKLCRRFIADDPPESVVDRASRTFLKSGGDIRAVLKTILTSPEFYSQAAFRAKVKSPFELVASSLRALRSDTDAGIPLLMGLARMGQPMFQYEAPAGFPDRAGTWINSGTLLVRIKFAMLLASNRVPGTQVDLQQFAKEGTPPEVLLEDMSRRLLGGLLAPETRQAILKKVEGANGTPGDDPSRGVAMIAGLVLASPEFQRR